MCSFPSRVSGEGHHKEAGRFPLPLADCPPQDGLDGAGNPKALGALDFVYLVRTP